MISVVPTFVTDAGDQHEKLVRALRSGMTDGRYFRVAYGALQKDTVVTPDGMIVELNPQDQTTATVEKGSYPFSAAVSGPRG